MGILALALRVILEEELPEILSGTSRAAQLLASIHRSWGAEGLFFALTGLAIVAQLGRSATQFSARWAAARLQARVEADLRYGVVSQIMGLSYSDIRSYRIGDLTSLLEHASQTGHAVRLANLVIANMLMVSAYALVLLWLSPSMTLGALLGFILLGYLMAKVIRRVKHQGRRFTNSSVRLMEQTVEVIAGVREIRAFGREAYALDRAQETIRDSHRARFRGLSWQASLSPVVESLTIGGVAFFLAAWIAIEGTASGALPRLLTFLIILARTAPRIKVANDRTASLMSIWQYVARLQSFLSREPTVSSSQEGLDVRGFEKAVEFKDVALQYPGQEKLALDSINLVIEKGQTVALVGRSGAGKSSMADLLVGLYRPTSGSVVVDGADLRDISWGSWRRLMGVVSQDTFIFHGSVYENIAFGRTSASLDEIVESARNAGADEFIREFPGGYQHVVGDQGFRLSGGQKQRISIARAFVREPEILVLDEATSGLDSVSEREIQSAFERLRRERTVLVIAHRLATVAQADLIVVLEDGKIIETGDHKSLLERRGSYFEMWSAQGGVHSGMAG